MDVIAVSPPMKQAKYVSLFPFFYILYVVIFANIEVAPVMKL